MTIQEGILCDIYFKIRNQFISTLSGEQLIMLNDMENAKEKLMKAIEKDG